MAISLLQKKFIIRYKANKYLSGNNIKYYSKFFIRNFKKIKYLFVKYENTNNFCHVKSFPQFNQGKKVSNGTKGAILLPRAPPNLQLFGVNILAMLYVRVSSCFSAKQPTPS